MVEQAGNQLTKNQSLVMAALSKAEGPMSAYNILDELRDKGLRAPLQVYRAIDKLLELGLVHRLESLNAFVACRHPACETTESVAFMICETCGHVEEISDVKLAGELHKVAGNAGFKPSSSVVELRGCCRDCRGK